MSTRKETSSKVDELYKRLKKQMPEFVWSVEDLTNAEAQDLKRAPFVVQSQWLSTPLECRWTGRSWRVTAVKDADAGS